ncbi:MAG: aspartyl-phosphate phosphatase Spo0E family protein [Kurthia sp.]|nr:aspartyl-phosphate phosphatase Spo0E family protein [Candidatus Kurthia equi]
MSEVVLKKLEQTREKMIQCGLENGFLNDETIRLSRKLDQLLNLYQLESVSTDYEMNINSMDYDVN